MNSEKHLAREHFELLLDEQSNAAVPAHIAEHLEECPRCRETLERTAADPSWWNCLEDLSTDDLHSTFASPAVDGGGKPSEDPGPRHARRPLPSDYRELLDAPSHPEMLGQLNQFEIERIIGRGGMGVVFKGFDRELHRTVAIKLMSPHLAHNATARKRFEREARAAAAVVHPNVIPIHGVSLFKGQPLIVMPLIAGSSLQAHVEKLGPLETKDVVRIGMQIAAGLSAAHDQGLIHRDIKPANILLEQDVSRVVITDFGLARAADELAMTQTGWLAGTPHYMSPEQARGMPIDARSDLFSLGAVLYFIATGREPFRAEKPVAVLHKICHDPATPVNQLNCDIPLTLSNIIERLMEKDSHDRFASASRTQKLLEEYLAELQQPNRGQRPMKVVTRRQVEKRWRYAQRAALFAIVVAVCGLVGWIATARPWSRTNADSASTFPAEIMLEAHRLQDKAFLQQIWQLDRELDAVEQKMEWMLPLPNANARPIELAEPPKGEPPPRPKPKRFIVEHSTKSVFTNRTGISNNLELDLVSGLVGQLAPSLLILSDRPVPLPDERQTKAADRPRERQSNVHPSQRHSCNDAGWSNVQPPTVRSLRCSASALSLDI